jgi:hypothetical protein
MRACCVHAHYASTIQRPCVVDSTVRFIIVFYFFCTTAHQVEYYLCDDTRLAADKFLVSVMRKSALSSPTNTSTSTSTNTSSSKSAAKSTIWIPLAVVADFKKIRRLCPNG